MKEIYTKITVRKDEMYDKELEFFLHDYPREVSELDEYATMLYDSTKDEEIIAIVSRMEYEQTSEQVFSPSGEFEDQGITYATGIQYRLPDEERVYEHPVVEQAVGKQLEWRIYLDSRKKEMECFIEFYMFYRDQDGDIRRIHKDNLLYPLLIPERDTAGAYITLVVTRGAEETLGLGRYYFAFLLRDKKKKPIGKPIVQYMNIAPSKPHYTRPRSNEMVGMEAIYDQMEVLAQQKLFNDQRRAMNLLPVPINLNAAVMGTKGSGKSAFAQVLFDFYLRNGLIEKDRLDVVDASTWSPSLREDDSMLTDCMSFASGGMLYIENAGSLITTDTRGNKNRAVQTLVSRLKENADHVAVVIADTPDRITELLSIADLKSYIDQIYKLPELTIDHIMSIAERECDARKFVLTEETKKSMKSYLSSLPNPTSEDVNTLIDKMVSHMSFRVVNDMSDLFQTKEKLTTLLPEDVPQPQVGGFEESMSKLNRLVGLKNLKYNIETHLNLVRFSHLRQQHGLQVSIPPLHMIFTGNPGTGKTTVAGLLGEIYASLGILKTGHVIKVDRKKLVGQYIGDTEENTKRALQQAHGNILFVDEAYTLVGDPDDKRDFGPKALDCLLDELGKENTDMIIILAGYPDEMEQLLKSNKGLQSRFPYTFHFEDYTEAELLEIAVKTAENSGYTFSDEAYERLRNLIHREVTQRPNKEDKHFGNARYITRLISTRIIPNMSRRVLSSADADASPLVLSRIEAADIPMKSAETDYTIDEALIARTLAELDALTGREEIKRTIHDLVTLARTRQQSGDELAYTIPLHWTFTGATGTGKSSVARLLAQLLYAFHLISSDRMTQLRMPQTAQNTWSSYDIDLLLRDTMKQAGHGLLFIDLDDIAGTHIDIQWLRCKLTSLTAEMPGSYAFVIAVDDARLQTQPIDMPLSTSVLHFPNYTVDELMAILTQRLSRQGFSLSPDAAHEIYQRILLLSQNRPGLANARTIKHICTALTAEAQLRVLETQKSSISTAKNEPVEITIDDLSSVKWKEVHNPKIGF